MLKKFIYYNNEGKKTKIYIKPCNTIMSKFLGLMFKSKSPPLLFIFNKQKKLTIHSLFCKPFKAIWLDENKKVTKTEDVDKWKLSISGHGKYLLEIPIKR